MKTKTVIVLALVVAVAAGIYWMTTRPEAGGGGMVGAQGGHIQGVAPKELKKGDPIREVKVPELTGEAKMGALAFAAKCATCHGENGGGREGIGPPLVHKFYRPAHHGDAAFYMAAQNGVRSHHWRFGNMPPVKGITRAEVATIIAYIRALQKENGIF